MSYTAHRTDQGLEIRDKNENVVWGPSENYSWPPDQEMAGAVIADANISEPTKSVLQLLVGNVEIQDEATQS